MSDIFHEVDEEVRREQFKKLWDKYSIYIIAAAILFVAGIGAWRGYQWWEAKKAAEDGAAFEAAVTLSEAGKHAEAETAFEKLAAQSPAGYRMLASLRAAAELAQRDPQAAVKEYDALAADSALSRTMQDIASLRAAMLQVDTASLADMQQRLGPLAEPDHAFRHTARELLALSAWRNGDIAAARRYIDIIVTDAGTPPGTRGRIDVLSSLIAGSGKS